MSLCKCRVSKDSCKLWLPLLWVNPELEVHKSMSISGQTKKITTSNKHSNYNWYQRSFVNDALMHKQKSTCKYLLHHHFNLYVYPSFHVAVSHFSISAWCTSRLHRRAATVRSFPRSRDNQAQNALQAMGMGQFPICKLKWDLLKTFVTACIIDENTFSAPFGIFYVRTEIWKENFHKKSYTTPQWDAFHLQTPVSKWELP